jgi:L-serine deaminase
MSDLSLVLLGCATAMAMAAVTTALGWNAPVTYIAASIVLLVVSAGVEVRSR